MFDKEFLHSVRHRKYHKVHTSLDYDLYDFIKYIHNHPPDHAAWVSENKRLWLTSMETRNSTPSFAKNIINELAKKFPKNKITCHAFCGFTADSKSFDIHKDQMDVFYLQVIGEINWSIWESDSKDSVITPHEGNCIFKEKFLPGDCIWIPRGTYHYIEPITTRVGFSFGIEGDPDPSSYV